MREIFLSSDAYCFFDSLVELNHHLGDIDLVDFHRFLAVFNRMMGW
jgi:hypothetical protein